jgi:hypothetical protein
MGMRGIEVVMLKWLLVVSLVLGMGTHLAQAQTMSLEELQQAYGNYEASCQNMTLVKLESAEAAFSGKVKSLPFDMEKCSRVLKPIQMNDLLEQFFSLALESDQASTSNSQADDTVDQKTDEQLRNSLVKSLHAKAQPLADACVAVAAGRERNADVLCYFGGPTTKSSKQFKVIYQSKLDAAVPDSETICSSEPITWNTASTKAFQDFLPVKGSSMTWAELQLDLEQDGFHCDQERCVRNIVGILISTSKVLEEKSDANGTPSFGIIPRQLIVYRGDWQYNGQIGGCFVDRDGKQTGKCTPDNGVSKGICLSGEYWHTWFFVIAAMNVFKVE